MLTAVLKKPLHTSIAVEMEEFDDIEVAEKLHIIISVRDFRAILQHANWTSSELNAAYSRPGRPMKISYNGDGITCDFVLMTVDEKSTAAQKKGRPQAAAKQVRPGLDATPSNRPAAVAEDEARQPSPVQQQQQQQEPQDQHARMLPPRRSNAPRSSQFDIRAPTKQPPSTLKSESLFLPQPDEDEQWEPVNPDEDGEDGESARLEWDASNGPVSILLGLRKYHVLTYILTQASTMRISDHFNDTQGNPAGEAGGNFPSELEPTQRLSDVRKFGLFSD